LHSFVKNESTDVAARGGQGEGSGREGVKKKQPEKGRKVLYEQGKRTYASRDSQTTASRGRGT